MIYVFLKVALAPRKFSKSMLGRFCAYRLQDSPTFSIPFPLSFNLVARIYLAIAGHGQVDNAEINAQPSSWVKFRRFGNFTNLVEIKLAIAINEIGLTLAMFKKLKLPITAYERNPLPTSSSPDIHSLVIRSPRQDSLVISDGSVFEEDPLMLVVKFVGIRDLGLYPDRDLGGKTKPLTHVIIGQLMQGKLVKGLGFPSYLADIVASSIGLFKCIEKGLVLLFSWLEFDLCN